MHVRLLIIQQQGGVSISKDWCSPLSCEPGVTGPAPELPSAAWQTRSRAGAAGQQQQANKQHSGRDPSAQSNTTRVPPAAQQKTATQRFLVAC